MDMGCLIDSIIRECMYDILSQSISHRCETRIIERHITKVCNED